MIIAHHHRQANPESHYKTLPPSNLCSLASLDQHAAQKTFSQAAVLKQENSSEIVNEYEAVADIPVTEWLTELRLFTPTGSAR